MEGVGRFGWVTDPEGDTDRAVAARVSYGSSSTTRA